MRYVTSKSIVPPGWQALPIIESLRRSLVEENTGNFCASQWNGSVFDPRICSPVELRQTKGFSLPPTQPERAGGSRKTIIGIPLSRCWIRAWLSQEPMYSRQRPSLTVAPPTPTRQSSILSLNPFLSLSTRAALSLRVPSLRCSDPPCRLRSTRYRS